MDGSLSQSSESCVERSCEQAPAVCSLGLGEGTSDFMFICLGMLVCRFADDSYFLGIYWGLTQKIFSRDHVDDSIAASVSSQFSAGIPKADGGRLVGFCMALTAMQRDLESTELVAKKDPCRLSHFKKADLRHMNKVHQCCPKIIQFYSKEMRLLQRQIHALWHISEYRIELDDIFLELNHLSFGFFERQVFVGQDLGYELHLGGESWSGALAAEAPLSSPFQDVLVTGCNEKHFLRQTTMKHLFFACYGTTWKIKNQ